MKIELVKIEKSSARIHLLVNNFDVVVNLSSDYKDYQIEGLGYWKMTDKVLTWLENNDEVNKEFPGISFE